MSGSTVAIIPFTTPFVTVTLLALLLAQIPPVVLSLSVIVVPAHTLSIPLISATVGSGSTVMVFCATDDPQELVTVYSSVSRPGVIPVIVS